MSFGTGHLCPVGSFRAVVHFGPVENLYSVRHFCPVKGLGSVEKISWGSLPPSAE
jgi:hypothetical protein